MVTPLRPRFSLRWLLIAFTVVSMGIARADTLMPSGNSDAELALSIPLALLIAGLGGLAAGLVHNARFPFPR